MKAMQIRCKSTGRQKTLTKNTAQNPIANDFTTKYEKEEKSYIRREKFLYSISSSWQSDATEEENYQNNVWECSCKVDGLKKKIIQNQDHFARKRVVDLESGVTDF